MSWPCRGDDYEDERMEYRHPLYGPEPKDRCACQDCEYGAICDYAPLREDLCEVYGIRALESNCGACPPNTDSPMRLVSAWP